MNKKELDKQLNKWAGNLAEKNRQTLLARLSGLKSIYPFNEYEYRLMYLLNNKVITFTEYETLRKLYIASNPYLHLYGLSPRVFGEIWAHQHLIDINQRFKKPSRDVDKKYSGDYDLYIKDKEKIIKVEVKASRAINTEIRDALEDKALSFKPNQPNWMNFQQLKLDIADIFVFIGVWTDKILYWVLTNKEIKKHPMRSHQHRGGIEFQIGITNKNINDFKEFLVSPSNLIKVILDKTK